MYTDVQCCVNVRYGREDVLHLYLGEYRVYVALNINNHLLGAKEFQANFNNKKKLNKYYVSSTKPYFFKIIKRNDWYVLRLYPYNFRHFVDTVGQKRGPDSAATSARYNKTGSAADMYGRPTSMSSEVLTRESSVLANLNHAP